MSHRGRRETSVQIREWKRSTSRERVQDRIQTSVMNAANDSQGHDRAAAILRLGNDGSEGEEFRHAIRSSDSERASAVQFAPSGTCTSHGRRPAPGFADVGHSRMRPCSSCCWHCRRRSRPCARWGCPHPRSDAVSICDGAGAYRNAGCIHARCRLARPHRQVFCCIRRLPVASYDCMSHLSTACCAV